MAITTRESLPEFAELGQTPLAVGRASTSQLRLMHATVSRRHATITRTADRVTVVDHNSRYGTFVNGMRVRSIELHLGDRLQFGTVVVYRLEPDGLRRESDRGGMALEASGVCLHKNGRLIVEDARFQIPAGSFVGILGPSGVGKTTLLNCLAGYIRPTTGCIVIDDGAQISSDLAGYRASLAYVTQEDIVYPTLSGRENLHYAAQLRLGSTRGSSETAQAVDRVLTQVDLSDHQHTRAKDLSSGQRKRLSVAIELLRRPRLMLLDEPTSGLDPATEAALMEQMKQIARQGTTVVCTTHLMESIWLFDRLIVLGAMKSDGGAVAGSVAFAGAPDSLLSHFGCRSFADLYELLQSGRFHSPTLLGSQLQHHTSVESASGRTFPTPLGSTSGFQGSKATAAIATNTLGASASKQLLLLTKRACKILSRDWRLIGVTISQPVVLGVLISLTQFKPTRVTSILFFTVAVAIWLGLNNAVRDLVRERRHYVRDRLVGLQPGLYFASRCVLWGLVGFAQLILLWFVVKQGCSMILPEHSEESLAVIESIWLLVVLLLAYAGGLGMALCVSALSSTEETAVAFLPLLIMPQLLLSAVATGYLGEGYRRPHLFSPLVVSFQHDSPQQVEFDAPANHDASKAATAVKYLSMLCLSRPATIAAERPRVGGHPHWIWIGDLCHLLILDFGIWIVAYLTFKSTQEHWPRLIGLS